MKLASKHLFPTQHDFVRFVIADLYFWILRTTQIQLHEENDKVWRLFAYTFMDRLPTS
jgi:hypothetical protein